MAHLILSNTTDQAIYVSGLFSNGSAPPPYTRFTVFDPFRREVLSNFDADAYSLSNRVWIENMPAQILVDPTGQRRDGSDTPLFWNRPWFAHAKVKKNDFNLPFAGEYFITARCLVGRPDTKLKATVFSASVKIEIGSDPSHGSDTAIAPLLDKFRETNQTMPASGLRPGIPPALGGRETETTFQEANIETSVSTPSSLPSERLPAVAAAGVNSGLNKAEKIGLGLVTSLMLLVLMISWRAAKRRSSS